jgi:ABC-2 type transport system ATP-binding protein
MLHRPQLLLLDEPTAGVDPKARRDFWEEIHLLAGHGITVLVSTHYMDEAERCHRLAYLSYGRVLAKGTPDHVVENAKLTTWMVEGKDLDELIIALKGLPGIDQVVPFGTAVHVSGANAEQLAQAIEPFRANPALRWSQTEPGLEDVFVHLTDKAHEGPA